MLLLPLTKAQTLNGAVRYSNILPNYQYKALPVAWNVYRRILMYWLEYYKLKALRQSILMAEVKYDIIPYKT